ncbi:MAG: hypothetical protein HFJ54_00800 [Clostridia bacterium]|nr:hypothetical protein [Clostridia bacterium]
MGKENREQIKVTNLVRSIVTLYFQKTGKYSEEEIEERVNTSIKRVILEPKKGEVLGYASLDNPEITIFGIDDKVPTTDEILWNLGYYKATILHEGEHKFFDKKDERGNIIGSALLMLLDRNKEFKNG